MDFSDKAYSQRAFELVSELLFQVYLRQNNCVPGSPDWLWLEEVFNMLVDIKGYVSPGISDDQRPVYCSLTEYRGRFRFID